MKKHDYLYGDSGDGKNRNTPDAVARRMRILSDQESARKNKEIKGEISADFDRRRQECGPWARDNRRKTPLAELVQYTLQLPDPEP